MEISKCDKSGLFFFFSESHLSAPHWLFPYLSAPGAAPPPRGGGAERLRPQGSRLGPRVCPTSSPYPPPGLTSLAELTAAGGAGACPPGPAALPAAPAWPCCRGCRGHGSPWPVSSHAWPPPTPAPALFLLQNTWEGGRQASPHAQGDLGSWPSALRRKRGPLGPTCGVSLLTSQRSGGPPSASSPDD